jgi:hypothetical protein
MAITSQYEIQFLEIEFLRMLMKSLTSVIVTARNNKIIIRKIPKYIPEKANKNIMLFKLKDRNRLDTKRSIIPNEAETIYFKIDESMFESKWILFFFFTK